MKTAGAFDKELMLIETTSAMTSTTTGSAVDFHGDDLYELNYRAVVGGTISGTTPKIVLKIQGSDDRSNWHDIVTFPDITAAGEMNIKVRGKGRYRRAVATVSGTTPSFGFVKVGVSTGGVL
ncbi:MAG: hypothetical protein IJI14_19570 [Anaerolineaceae bacterium]|nr:hypothetical protein [Anaerolineaceae bacterium]